MPPVIPSHKYRGLVKMAEAQNTVDGLTSQQQSGVSAPTPGGKMSEQTSTPVYTTGIIPVTPSGTPGPSTARYGLCFYDSAGVLQAQLDQWGWHKYNNVGGVAVYASEIVTYS